VDSTTRNYENMTPFLSGLWFLSFL